MYNLFCEMQDVIFCETWALNMSKQLYIAMISIYHLYLYVFVLIYINVYS